jgi:hypothetical protein
MLLVKYFVKSLPIKLFSWGMTLSKMQIILVLPFLLFRTILATVPKEGDIDGCQYFIRRISGFSFLILKPVLSQLNGLTEFKIRVILISFGAGASVNCDLPGKRKPGY